MQQQGKRRKKKRRKNRNKVIAARITFLLVLILTVGLLVFGGYKLYSLLADAINDDVSVTTVTVSNRGVIRQTIVEEFNTGTYDEESLKKDIDTKVSEAGGEVSAEELEVEDGRAVLKMKYDSDDAMSAFNEEVFYADTIDALKKQGVTFDSAAEAAGGSHAVIVSEAMDIRCPKKILYADGEISIDSKDEKLAHCTTQEGNLALLIY
jgi:hypothetical protein